MRKVGEVGNFVGWLKCRYFGNHELLMRFNLLEDTYGHKTDLESF